MYGIKKIKEYFFSKINKDLLIEALDILTEEERNIFQNMSKYDQIHSLEVYKKMKESELRTYKIYLKLALLHDCGKEKAGFLKRILHKLGFYTSLRKHSEIGEKKLKFINSELSILIRNHHVKNYCCKMNLFQKIDDES